MPYTYKRGKGLGLLLAGWVLNLTVLFILIASPVSAVVGEDWDEVNPLPTSNHLNSVATGNGGLLVAVGDFGTIVTSSDGISWTQQTSGTTSHLNGITWDGSQFMAVGGKSDSIGAIVETAILTSPDGITWTSQSPGTNTVILNDIVWNGSQFVAAGSEFIISSFGSAVLTSPDGIVWIQQVVPSGSEQLTGITWDGSQFVAVGRTSTVGDTIFHQPGRGHLDEPYSALWSQS